MKKAILFFIKNPTQLFKFFYTIMFYVLLIPIGLVVFIFYTIYVLSMILYQYGKKHFVKKT